MKKIVILLLFLTMILVGCTSKEAVSESKENNSSEKKNEVTVKEIDNEELMGRTGLTVGYYDVINVDKGKDHYTIRTRKKDDILWWIVGLQNGFVGEVEFLSKIQFGIANGDDGFESSIKSSGNYISGRLFESAFISKKKEAKIKGATNAVKTVNNVEEIYNINEAAMGFIKDLPIYEEFSELDYDLSEKTMSVLLNLVYYNYYPDIEFTYPKLYDKNENVLMVHNGTGDNYKWKISYDTKFRKFDNVEFNLEEDGDKRKEQIQLLIFDIYQLLKGKETQTVYGEYAQEAVDWYLNFEKAQQITPDEVLEFYYEALDNPESENVTDNFREKITPLLKISEETLGELGLPNELLPEVRLNSVEENMIWMKVELLEFANEAYKTGTTVRLNAIFDPFDAKWYLDDIEIIEAEDLPFHLTWEEVEKHASLRTMEIEKSAEQNDPDFYQFTVLNENQSFSKDSIVKIDRRNGLMSYVSAPEDNINTVEEQTTEESIPLEEESLEEFEENTDEQSNNASNKNESLEILAQTETKERNNEYLSDIQMREDLGFNYQLWDGVLNDIYAVLKTQLSESEMSNLKNEQLKWIETRDATAQAKYDEEGGGSLSTIVQVETLFMLTKERCYELVNEYME